MDETDRVTDKLETLVDSVCTQVKGFYYGRLDIRFKSLSELENGQNFSIIEINGAGAEPTHIYDPKHSIFFAWKEIAKHWKLLFKVSQLNRNLGHGSISFLAGMRLLKSHNKLSKHLEAL